MAVRIRVDFRSHSLGSASNDGGSDGEVDEDAGGGISCPGSAVVAAMMKV